MNTSRTPSRARQLLVVPVLLAALTGLAACGSDDPLDAAQGSGDTMVDPTTPAETESSPTGTRALVVGGGAAATGKCAVPTAETLANATTAFEGTVVTVEQGIATLQVTKWFAGEESATVTVAAPDQDLQELLMAVDFQQGQTYLVSAAGERVTLCGFTAQKTPELESLYAEAFSL